MVADVPVGALLSGGIDSSTTVALMREFKPADQIETFSIGFDDPSFDESQYAQLVARSLGVKHYLRQFASAEMLDQVSRVIESLDEPFADPSILPVSMLCEFARERVTVALAGDGGDELFAGYDPFLAVRAAERYRRWIPDWLHQRVMLPLSSCLPASARNMSLQFKLSRFLRGAHQDPSLRPAVWMGACTLQQLANLAPGLRSRLSPEDAYGPVLAAHERLAEIEADAIDQTLDFFQRFYLTDDILVKVDRASMLHSLEVRSPFLDTALVEYVNGLPSWLKLRRGVAKYILKQTLLQDEGRRLGIPPAIIGRKKKGFGIPVARWIRRELREVFRDALIGQWPESLLPMFDPAAIAGLYRAHVAGRRNNYKELWALFVLSLWARQHLTREPASRTRCAAAVTVG
jgi:asparagine synthase (glutamine-hydrolysing)